MSNILSIRGLEAGYGPTQVLHRIDLDVASGAITAILGSNGAGKTSLLRAISGMIRRTGTIDYDGRSILTLPTEKIAQIGIAHVPDGRGTLGFLSVEDNLMVGAYSRRDRRAIPGDMKEIYGYFPRLDQRRKQLAHTLSGGEQQMLAIGRALMLSPKLLIMDEPSFGLAPMIIQEIFAIMRRIVEERSVSILLVEQNARQSLRVAKYAYVLETGRIAIEGDSATLAADNSVRRHYLGS